MCCSAHRHSASNGSCSVKLSSVSCDLQVAEPLLPLPGTEAAIAVHLFAMRASDVRDERVAASTLQSGIAAVYDIAHIRPLVTLR